MDRQEAINTAIGNYLSYLIYGDIGCLQQATHWFYYASLVGPVRFSLSKV